MKRCYRPVSTNTTTPPMFMPLHDTVSPTLENANLPVDEQYVKCPRHCNRIQYTVGNEQSSTA